MLAEFIAGAGHLCRRNDGILLAMKGRDPQNELAALLPGYQLKGVVRLIVPDLYQERHVVEMIRNNSIKT